MSKKNNNADMTMSVVSICCLLVALVALIPVGNWLYIALVCLVMLVQIGIMSARIFSLKRKNSGDHDNK